MFRWIFKHAGGFVSASITSILSAGLLKYLADEQGIHPDDWVARMLKDALGISVAPYAWYFIVGGCGLLGAIGWEILVGRKRRKETVPSGPLKPSLAEDANAIGAKIFAVVAEYQPVMSNPLAPQADREKISAANTVSQNAMVAKYLAQCAPEAHRIATAAETRGILTPHEVWLMGERPIAYKAVESVGKLMFRIAEAEPASKGNA